MPGIVVRPGVLFDPPGPVSPFFRGSRPLARVARQSLFRPVGPAVVGKCSSCLQDHRCAPRQRRNQGCISGRVSARRRTRSRPGRRPVAGFRHGRGSNSAGLSGVHDRPGTRGDPAAPLVPRDDPTTLFTGSGMQPLLPYLLGADHPDGRRLTDSQTCLRVQDIEDVGDNRHTTFFEMLGNWSLGDYFKAEQIPQIFSFLIERVGLDPARIFVSCFIGDDRYGIEKDTESAGHLDRSVRRRGRIHRPGRPRHRRGGRAGWAATARGSRSTDTRTGGVAAATWRPCRSASRAARIRRCSTCSPRSSRIRRSARTATRTATVGASSRSATRCSCSTGAPNGFRTVAAAQRGLRWWAGPDRGRVPGIQRRLPDQSAVADHRASAGTVGSWLRHRHGGHAGDRRPTCVARSSWPVDGVRPSNKTQGYVMRRLVRRAIRFAFDLGLTEDFFGRRSSRSWPRSITTTIPSWRSTGTRCRPCSRRRNARSAAPCPRGIEKLGEFAAGGVGGAELFTLYDTYGFPVELSTEEAGRAASGSARPGASEFDERMAEQRARSQRASVMHP